MITNIKCVNSPHKLQFLNQLTNFVEQNPPGEVNSHSITLRHPSATNYIFIINTHLFIFI